MRNLAAILLMGLFFFNWVGYRLLNSVMEDDASRRLDARLDRQQYDEDQLITIKVPVTHLSYYNNSISFERSNGQVEINGIPYRYVKRRIYHDSLEMLCIPNQGELQLRQSGANYFKGVNDIERQQGSTSGSPPNVHKSFLSDPYIGNRQIRMEALSFVMVPKEYPYSADLSSISFPTDERPPAVVA